MKLIPAKLYKKIVELVPIVCVDVVIRHNGQYVLVKRATEPLKGEWWIVGGRMHKGESTLQTAKRKVKEELGINVKLLWWWGFYEDHYPKSAWGVPTSSVSIVYATDLKEFNPKMDKTITDIKLSDQLPNRFLKHYHG